MIRLPVQKHAFLRFNSRPLDAQTERLVSQVGKQLDILLYHKVVNKDITQILHRLYVAVVDTFTECKVR